MAASACRILVGASVRQQQHVFDAYYRSLQALIRPKNCTLTYAFVNDNDADAVVWPNDCIVLPAPQRPMDALYGVDANTHHWNTVTFEHLAKCKQLLIDYAINENFDYIFLVDSDLLIEPSTLLSLHAAGVDIVSGVFWTKWDPSMPPLPQCWLSHPYGFNGLGMRDHEYIAALKQHKLVRVLGGGACCLFNAEALTKVRYHPRLPLPAEGMWQGEDRTLAVMAQQRRVTQYADAWPRIYHAYNTEARLPEHLAEAWTLLSAERQTFAKIGDLVNVRLTPMEDPNLEQMMLPDVRNVRGRLGSIMMAPELEAAILTTRIGSSCIVDVQMSAGHTVYPANATRAIRVEVIDARPS